MLLILAAMAAELLYERHARLAEWDRRPGRLKRRGR